MMSISFGSSNRNMAANDVGSLENPRIANRRNRRLEALAAGCPDKIYCVAPDWTRLEPWQQRASSGRADGQQESSLELERFFDSRDFEIAMSAIHAGTPTKLPFQFECRTLHADGSPSWTLLRASPVLDRSNEVVEWIVTARDIDLRKQMEAALLRCEQLASLGRMTASISHEINNPLEAVTNLLFLARLDAQLTTETAQVLEHADVELQRVANITRQFLGFYRESKSPVPTSLRDTVDSALNLLKTKIALKRAVIERQFLTDISITAAPGELRQVFANLIANGLDAIPVGGTITIRISSHALKRSGIWFTPVHVADNGSGIPALDKKNIFDPFFTTKGTSGTGLGLWISKQIIEKFGGAIRVVSCVPPERRGTVFSVLVPTSDPATK